MPCVSSNVAIHVPSTVYVSYFVLYYVTQTNQRHRYDIRQCVVHAFDLCHEYHTLSMASTPSIPHYCVYEIMYSDTDKCIFKAVASKTTK